jgi:hypothetical protein
MPDMGDIHRLIEKHGIDAARNMVGTGGERRVVDAAWSVLENEKSSNGFTYSGFALTSLPHKRLDKPHWQREGHRITLLVEAGRDRHGTLLGVPYGSVARLILVYLQTEAIRNNSIEVDLGPSLNAWMRRLSFNVGGKTYLKVREQTRWISACRLIFFTKDVNGLEHRYNGGVVKDAYSASVFEDNGNLINWQNHVRLDKDFFQSLKDHPLPIRMEAIRAIRNRSLAIDVYTWLAYRLHVLSKPTPVSWLSVHSQFGAGFRQWRQLKPTFKDALQMALAVYPEAHVDVNEREVVLYPSRPPFNLGEDGSGFLISRYHAIMVPTQPGARMHCVVGPVVETVGCAV